MIPSNVTHLLDLHCPIKQSNKTTKHLMCAYSNGDVLKVHKHTRFGRPSMKNNTKYLINVFILITYWNNFIYWIKYIIKMKFHLLVFTSFTYRTHTIYISTEQCLFWTKRGKGIQCSNLSVFFTLVNVNISIYKCVFLKQLLLESFYQTLIQKQMITFYEGRNEKGYYVQEIPMLCVLFGSPISGRLHNPGGDKGLCFAWSLNKTSDILKCHVAKKFYILVLRN